MANKKHLKVWGHVTEDACWEEEENGRGIPLEFPPDAEILNHMCKRSFVVAGDDDLVVISHETAVPKGEIDLLRRLGLGPRSKNVIVIDAERTGLADRDGLPQIKIKIVEANKEVLHILGDKDITKHIDTFTGSSQIIRRVAGIFPGCEINTPGHAWCVHCNNKKTIQRILNKFEGELGPIGRVCKRGEVPGVIRQCLRKARGKVIIKPLDLASGLFQQMVDYDTVDTLDIASLPEEVVIQRYIPGCVDASMTFDVRRGGMAERLFATVQMISNSTHHQGNIYPPRDLETGYALSPAILNTMEEYVMEVLREEDKFHGICSFDFLVDPKKHKVYLLEWNARKPAPWYAWEASRRIFGEVLPFIMRGFEMKPGVGLGDIEAKISDLLLDKGKMTGVVPFNYVALPGKTFIYTITYAPQERQVAEIFGELKKRLGNWR